MTIDGTPFYLYLLTENVISIVCADLSHHSLWFQWENNECAWLWGLVFYWVLCNNHTGKLASCCCLGYIFSSVCFPPVSNPLVDSLCVLVPVFSCEPGGPLSPFSGFTTSSFLSLPVFLPLSVMQRLIHIYIHAHIQSHPHIHPESSLCVPCMALCCGHNTRGQAMRSHSTGELQAWPNLHHPHRTQDKQSCGPPPPAHYIFSCHTALEICLCNIDLCLSRYRRLQAKFGSFFYPPAFQLAFFYLFCPPPCHVSPSFTPAPLSTMWFKKCWFMSVFCL